MALWTSQQTADFCNFSVRHLVHDNRAPRSPSMIPSSQQASSGGGPANVPGGGRGWIDPAPLSNPPGVRMIDAIVEADTARQTIEHNLVVDVGSMLRSTKSVML